MPWYNHTCMPYFQDYADTDVRVCVLKPEPELIAHESASSLGPTKNKPVSYFPGLFAAH